MILKACEQGRVSDFSLGVRTRPRHEQSQGEPAIGLSDLFQKWTQKGLGGGVASEMF